MFVVRQSAIFLSHTYTTKKVWVTETGHRTPVLLTRILSILAYFIVCTNTRGYVYIVRFLPFLVVLF